MINKKHIKQMLLIIPLLILLLVQFMVINIESEVNASLSQSTKISDDQQNIRAELDALLLKKEKQAERATLAKKEAAQKAKVAKQQAAEAEAIAEKAAQDAQYAPYLTKLNEMAVELNGGNIGNVLGSITGGTAKIGAVYDVQQTPQAIQQKCLQNATCAQIMREIAFNNDYEVRVGGRTFSNETVYVFTFRLSNVSATATALFGDQPLEISMLQYPSGGVQVLTGSAGNFKF